MFNFLRVKTKLELQVEEYIAFKSKSAPFIAEDQKKVLDYFIEGLNYKDVSEITLEDLNAHHNKLSQETTGYTTIKAMQALRAFMRYHKRVIDIKPKQITNEGVDLPKVAKNAIIIPMTRKRKVGRPLDVAFIKRIKKIREASKNEKGKYTLSFRVLADNENRLRGTKLRKGNICRAFHFDLSKVA